MKDKRGGGGVNVKCVREEEKEKGVQEKKEGMCVILQ